MNALMTLPAPPVTPPVQSNPADHRRPITPAEFHQMVELGIIKHDERVELLEGDLVTKMPGNPPHNSTLNELVYLLTTMLPQGWRVWSELTIELPAGLPIPDVAVIRFAPHRYRDRHPNPADTALVVEISDSSLANDRTLKQRVYARGGVVCFWIVNLIDGQVEVYTQPSGPTDEPAYGQRRVYGRGERVPVMLDGVAVGEIAVAEVLP